MFCTICEINKVDGRKNQTICSSCLEKLEEIKIQKEADEQVIFNEINCMVENLITPELLEEVTERLRSTPMHQLITKLLAHELMSLHIPSYKDGKKEISLIDVFIKTSELKNIIKGTPHVSNVVEDRIRELSEIKMTEMKEKGFKYPRGLGFILGS